ncbi:hypothetical protein IMG5_005430, partial [Ichthyophthirius multifiliis]
QQVLENIKEKEEKLKNANPRELLPRRKRRIYDRPLFDLDISEFNAWRSYDNVIYKVHKHAAPVVCKIPISPRLLQHAFGQGAQSLYNENLSTREYHFQDTNLDTYQLYDYKATTAYHGENLKDYDYDHQEHVRIKKRKQMHPSPEEFWEQDEPHMFRLNCSKYADFHKFKKWLLQEIEKRSKDIAYEQKILNKFGPFEIYDQYDKKYQINRSPTVFKYNRSYYLDEKPTQKQLKEDPYLECPKPAQVMEEKYRVHWPYQWQKKPEKNKNENFFLFKNKQLNSIYIQMIYHIQYINYLIQIKFLYLNL